MYKPEDIRYHCGVIINGEEIWDHYMVIILSLLNLVTEDRKCNFKSKANDFVNTMDCCYLSDREAYKDKSQEIDVKKHFDSIVKLLYEIEQELEARNYV